MSTGAWFSALVFLCLGCSTGVVEPPAFEPRRDGGAEASLPSFPDAGIGASSDAAGALHARADEAAATMMLRFWSSIGDPAKDYYWTYAHDWDVILDAVERSGGERFRGTATRFFEVQDARGWGRDFFDDKNWMALTLIRAYDLLGDARTLQRAESLFTEIMAGWDTS